MEKAIGAAGRIDGFEGKDAKGNHSDDTTHAGKSLTIVDRGSFREFLPPAARVVSPHLQALDLPVAFDDGVVVGAATLAGEPVLVAAQEGGFMGGAVGEVHGAKMTGLIARA